MKKNYIYLLERTKDSYEWPKGCRIWSLSPCAGWKIIRKVKVE